MIGVPLTFTSTGDLSRRCWPLAVVARSKIARHTKAAEPILWVALDFGELSRAAACPPVVFLRLEENTTGGRAASATLDARRS